MNRFLKNGVPFSALLTLSALPALADDPGLVNKIEASALVAAGKYGAVKDSSMTNGQKTNMNNQITPPAGPKVEHCCDPYVTADFIWWKASQDGLEYATTGFNGSPSSLADISKGTVHDPDFKYTPGFKVGAGLMFKHDNWDLYAQYTWLRENDVGSSVSQPSGSQLIGMYFFPSSSSLLVDGDHAKADWSLHFNVVDLELGRNYYISNYLTLRPHFGFKGAWIDQDFHQKFTGPGFLSEVNEITEIKAHFDQDFWGVGLRTGLNTCWYFVKDWGLYGDMALSALWCNFDEDRKDQWIIDEVETTTFHTGYNFYTVRPVLELGFGLRYETTFDHGNYELLLQAGWEEQVWFDHNNLIRPWDDENGNLNLDGLTVKAAFAF